MGVENREKTQLRPSAVRRTPRSCAQDVRRGSAAALAGLPPGGGAGVAIRSATIAPQYLHRGHFGRCWIRKDPRVLQKSAQLVLPGKDQEAPRRACAPRCGEIRSRIAGESEARPAAGPAGWGSEGPAAGTPEGRIRSRNRSRNIRPNQKAGSAGIRSRHQNAGTPNIRTPAIRTPKFGQPNQKIRAAETPD